MPGFEDLKKGLCIIEIEDRLESVKLPFNGTCSIRSDRGYCVEQYATDER